MGAIASAELIAELEATAKDGAPERRSRILQGVAQLFLSLSAAGSLNPDQVTVFDSVLLRLMERMIGQHGAGRETHQGRHQPGLAVEQQRLGFAAGKARLLPFHVLRLNEMRMRLGGNGALWGDGIHGQLQLRPLCVGE